MIRRFWRTGSILLAGLIGCDHGGDPSTVDPTASDAEAAVTVRVVSARSGTVVEAVEGLGRIEALPDHLATLTPAVEGHVHDLLVRQGAMVVKGQPIVELDKTAAQADLAEKTATRDGLKASLALLKSLPRPDEQKPHKLAIEQARVAVERADAILEKLKPLRSSNLASDQQIFDAEKAVEAARLQQQTAESQLQVLMIGPRPEAVAEAESRIQTAEGLVEFSQAHLDFHTIRAPIGGVLDSLTCHPGQTIAIGAPIGEVVDTRQVHAVVWLPAKAALAVKSGQSAGIRVDEARILDPDLSATRASGSVGEVEFVGRIADPQTGNLPVRILVENPEARLTIGQPVRVSIAVDEARDMLQVPVAALYDLGEGPILNVVRDGQVEALSPEVGTSRAGWVAVGGTDLEAGEPVIVEGGYNLPAETPVTVVEDQSVARAEDGR